MVAVNGKRKHEEIDDTPSSSPEKPITSSYSFPPPPPPTSSSSSFSTPSKFPHHPSKPTPTPSATPITFSTPVKKSDPATDEEYARQLAVELNAPRTRSGKDDVKRPTKKARTKKKSAAEVGSDEDDVNVPKKRKGGFQKEYALRFVFPSHPIRSLSILF